MFIQDAFYVKRLFNCKRFYQNLHGIEYFYEKKIVKQFRKRKKRSVKINNLEKEKLKDRESRNISKSCK